MTDKKCKMTERLDNLEELVKYLVQAVDRIGGMVQVLERRISPEEIRKVAQS